MSNVNFSSLSPELQSFIQSYQEPEFREELLPDLDVFTDGDHQLDLERELDEEVMWTDPTAGRGYFDQEDIQRMENEDLLSFHDEVWAHEYRTHTKHLRKVS